MNKATLTKQDRRYLDLLKTTLTDYLRVDNPHANAMPLQWIRPSSAIRRLRNRMITRFLGLFGLAAVKPSRISAEKRRNDRANGVDWPPLAETMVGLKRLDNLEAAIGTVLEDGIEGDLLEAGVWRGGASIFMQAVLTCHDATDRKVWLCDSFEGLPPPDPKFPSDAGFTFHEFSILAVSEEDVRRNFDRYNLSGDNLRFVKGYFENTLADAPVEKIALLRMDGDMYSSTISILNALYHKVTPGGFIIVDDYHIPACAEAVADFRKEHGIEEPIIAIDDFGSYWRKPKA